jgi:hypothetical protein
VPDEVEQELTLLSEGSCGRNWVNGGREGRAGEEKRGTFNFGHSILVTHLA